MRQMSEHHKKRVRNMDAREIAEFQTWLQIKCNMSEQDAADYIAQAKKVNRAEGIAMEYLYMEDN